MRDCEPVRVQCHLARMPLFAGLSVDLIERIAHKIVPITVLKGHALFHAGDNCKGMYLVVFGQFKLVFTSFVGAEKVVEIIQQGESFGEAIMLAEKNHLTSAYALQDSLVLHVPTAAILAELNNDPKLTARMIILLAKQNVRFMNDIESYALQSATQRIIGYFTNEIPDEAIKADELELELHVHKGVIASMLNITQEHFSRILSDLSARGLILISGRSIRIPKISNLIAFQRSP
ncbi:MAG TPA: Crp/Fnr family transcriptional regulator [Nitrospira sp.]|nr:Crp/Fnr family transcriptional regulator [Nitrospira sp.]HNG55421.1 Crp/Fnr family transcriptional regulator [Nitrospira sp.]HNM20063.1 Crp/Fnr family transcriptional regulator [Nitrospira sp.]HNO58902.1 Crp/Fnr family transcriptional regulator [Accumulibacter sp.]